MAAAGDRDRFRPDRERTARRRLSCVVGYGRSAPGILRACEGSALPARAGKATRRHLSGIERKPDGDDFRYGLELASRVGPHHSDAVDDKTAGLGQSPHCRWSRCGSGWSSLRSFSSARCSCSRSTGSRRLARRRGDQPGPGWHSLLTPVAVIIVALAIVPLLSMIFLAHRRSTHMVVAFACRQLASVLLQRRLGVRRRRRHPGARRIAASEHLAKRSLDSQPAVVASERRFAGDRDCRRSFDGGRRRVGLSSLFGAGRSWGWRVGDSPGRAGQPGKLSGGNGAQIMFEKPFRVGHRTASQPEPMGRWKKSDFAAPVSEPPINR